MTPGHRGHFPTQREHPQGQGPLPRPARPVLSLLQAPDVLVVGGGLVGLAAAYEAARRGASVTVLEKDVAGRHASTLNAGGVRRVNRHAAELPLAQRALALWPGLSSRLGADVRFRRSGHLLVAETEEELGKLAARARRERAWPRA